jgi:hypothetical protein
MGMDASLLAIGPFSKDIVDALEYPNCYYQSTPRGATVITTVTNCCTTRGSEELAQALGINPMRFEEHCDIKPDLNKVDIELFAGAAENGMDDVASFLKLAANGFKFYYMPNG